MNIFKNVYFQLLLLQLEEYDLIRFLKAVAKTKGMAPNRPVRKPLVFTAKLKTILAVSILIYLILVFFLFKTDDISSFRLISFAFFTGLYLYFSFFFLIIASILIFPFDFLVKEVTLFLAKRKIREFPNLKIIGIAGSYGKTGMKEFIATVLAQKYNVLKTPESVNTPFAISDLILKKLSQDTEIFVVEMGEYYRGDIKNICAITRPDIAVVTGINEAHLERLKTIGDAIATIFEIVENMDEKGIVLLNGNDDLVENNYKKFIPSREVYLYKDKSGGEFDGNLPGYILKKGQSKIFFLLLGAYNLDKIDAVEFLAKKLGLNENQIVAGIKNIKPVAHRLQPLVNRQTNTLIIDDSYNGNPDGVEEAINTLSQFKQRRKIYVTPGLVEMGKKTAEIHYNIGNKLAKVADLVVLIKNSVTPHIARGLKDGGLDENKIVFYESADQAYKNLNKIVKSGDVVLLQNDWPDNYL